LNKEEEKTREREKEFVAEPFVRSGIFSCYAYIYIYIYIVSVLFLLYIERLSRGQFHAQTLS